MTLNVSYEDEVWVRATAIDAYFDTIKVQVASGDTDLEFTVLSVDVAKTKKAETIELIYQEKE